MPCLACGRPSGPVCPACAASLRPAATRSIGSGVVARATWSHAGTGRRLVRRLKYDGLVVVASLAAERAPEPPVAATCLVPVPRVLARRIAYGSDPAALFARALAVRWGLPVVPALAAPAWAPRRAGRAHRPGPPALRAVIEVSGAVVVDDVVTTGATVRLAARLVGSTDAMSITMAAKSPARQVPLRTIADEHHL